MITIKPFVFNPFQENTFVLFDETKECVIVDPGMNSDEENNALEEYIREQNLQPVAMLNTHCHVDHVLGCKFVKEKYDVPFYIHAAESPILERTSEFAAFFGMQVETPPPADRFLEEQDTFRFGDSALKLLLVPGHSPGSLALYSEPDRFVIAGDALFRGSIGRTDLPGGDYDTLINNIKTKLLSLPREVTVFSGHGPSTSVGAEHDTNPFLT